MIESKIHTFKAYAMKKYIWTLFALALGISACNDDFLEKRPIETQTEVTAFQSYENFKTFSWGMYNTFADGQYVRGFNNYGTNYGGDMLAGYLSTYATSEPNAYRAGTIVAPTAGNGWDFSFIRRTNLMLSNIDQSQMTEAEKNHWRSVGYFFRAFRYMELVSRFGDVPWIEKPLAETETEEIYGPRTPRKEVTDHILQDLQYAEKNIKATGDGPNTINTNVVRALMSRFCLFEGTWRKYHELGDWQPYLTECVRVSNLLAKAFPNVDPNYDALCNSENLSGYAGIILYKEYLATVLTHSSSHTERTSSGNYEMPKYSVEMFLCSDGKPIGSSSVYAGDKNMYDEFRNRDRRLLFNVVPPYCMQKAVIGGMNPPSFDYPAKNVWNTTGYYTAAGVALDEYINLMPQLLPNSTAKRLPVFNWSGTTNFISPNINGPGQAPMASRSGYYMWKYYNLWETNSNMAALNTADKALFWIEEVLLNLAEAQFELGAFDQAVANSTINKLRARVGVANMNLGDINASFDPSRDPSVDPVLWEIRRERFAELIGHGFGFQDIRRWKKGDWYINRPQIGTYIKKADYKVYNASGKLGTATPAAWNNLALVKKDFSAATTEGYLKRFDNPKNLGKGWKDQYYLYAIPTNQLVLNPQLKPQNPGW